MHRCCHRVALPRDCVSYSKIHVNLQRVDQTFEPTKQITIRNIRGSISGHGSGSDGVKLEANIEPTSMENGNKKGAKLNADFRSTWVDFGCQVGKEKGSQNRPENTSKQDLKKDGLRDCQKSRKKTLHVSPAPWGPGPWGGGRGRGQGS